MNKLRTALPEIIEAAALAVLAAFLLVAALNLANPIAGALFIVAGFGLSSAFAGIAAIVRNTHAAAESARRSVIDTRGALDRVHKALARLEANDAARDG